MLLYAHDRSAGAKFKVANSLVADLWSSRTGALSTQVLQEFYVNATRKLAKPISPSRARQIIARYATWVVHSIEPMDIVEASRLEKRHKQSFWDALTIVAARRAGARVLLTEDLQHGRRLAGLTIVDPFR